MDDLGTALLVLILGDPLRAESGEGRKSGTTLPDGVISIGGGNNFDHVGLWAQSFQFLLKSIWESLVESGSSGKDNVRVKILSNVDVALLDRLESHGVHTGGLVSLLDKSWIEESLWGQESWGVHGDGLSIWELIHLLEIA